MYVCKEEGVQVFVGAAAPAELTIKSIMNGKHKIVFLNAGLDMVSAHQDRIDFIMFQYSDPISFHANLFYF